MRLLRSTLDGNRAEARGVQGDGHALEVQGLRKSFVKNRQINEVIRDLDLRVTDGEFVSIIGLSGCGKSTLLKVLAGLTPYQSGRVNVLGTKVVGPRADVGFMFQHLALLPWRTVLQNVLLPAELAGVDRRGARQRALACLEMVGLSGYEKYYLREISGGMQQRVALARVLMSDARLLLLDEPFSALDELTREGVNMLFMDICTKTKATALLVTHSIFEAVLMSDRVMVMPSAPGRPTAWIDIHLARPRTAESVREEEFSEAMLGVREALGMGG